MGYHPLVEVYPDADALADAAARAIADAVRTAIAERGIARIALAGGASPGPVYDRLAAREKYGDLDWNRTHVFFTDERAVPPDHPDSNFGMVHRLLLAPCAVPGTNVHRIRGEDHPAEAARWYTEELGLHAPDGKLRLDLVLLGVGEDGHTASLFPGTDSSADRDRLVHAAYVPRLNGWRITLGLRAINGARQVLVLAGGARKARVVAAAAALSEANPSLPVTLVRPGTGTLRWMVDAEAAAELPPAVRTNSAEPPRAT